MFLIETADCDVMSQLKPHTFYFYLSKNVSFSHFLLWINRKRSASRFQPAYKYAIMVLLLSSLLGVAGVAPASITVL